MIYESVAKCMFIVPAIIATCLGFKPQGAEIKQAPQVKIELPAEEQAEPPSTDSVEPSLNELIEKYFPEKAWEQAKKIANCESGGNSQAIGDGHLKFQKDGVTYGASYGYFQIRYLAGRPEPSQLLEPEFNVKYASEMYSNQGWQPWSCKKVLWK